jgi:hypothetical protein
MNPTDLYAELATSFPAMWPQYPDWVWVNIHDGLKLKAELLLGLIESTLKSSEAILLIHSEPGIALRVQVEQIAEHIAPFVLKCDVQLSDPQLNSFISINRYGLATTDA